MQLSDYSAFPADIPVIVEDDLFLYPFMISPIFLSDEKNVQAAVEAVDTNSLVMVCPTKPGHEGERSFDAIYNAGVIGSIMRKVTLPDGRIKVLFQGLARGRILEEVNHSPLIAKVDVIHSKPYNELKIEALMEVLREKLRQLSQVSNQFPPDLIRTIEENHEPNRIADLISSTIKIKKPEAYELFIEEDVEQRLLLLIDIISAEIEASKLQKEIRSKVHSRIEQVNKEYFLKEQLKQIQQELGTDTQREEEIEEYYKKLEAKKPYMNEDAYKEIKKQIDRFSRMHPDSADANMIQGWLDWVLEIPFGKLAKKHLRIEDVEKQLDKDHYGLKKPKERIVEYFSVRELAELRGVADREIKGAILCFAGPPGIGKTSLANSISKALKRKLVRIALGGLEDVNELRGHRRTYIGAMPGRIVQGLIDAGEMNPVMVLDEIDKVGRSMRGDPTSVLLEILDPEQNSAFRDYYLNFNIDLSQVIFIATANDIGSIPGPLRDRMEFIFLSSYTPQEKYEIAKRYLIPQELKKHALKKSEFSITKAALEMVIENYTREAGVRNLERQLAKIFRKIAREIVESGGKKKKFRVGVKDVPKYLGVPKFDYTKAEKKPEVGLVNGLAWTPYGGDILNIEATMYSGDGKLILTGRLGDVMKESGHAALSYLRSRASKYSIDEDIFKKKDIHIHVPEGAIPKDGPSAGITLATVMYSIFKNLPVPQDIAMTGEITLRGKVLPIGGLKEKLLAAHRGGIKKVIIPKDNAKDLVKIPDRVKKDLQIVPVTHIDEVIKEVFSSGRKKPGK